MIKQVVCFLFYQQLIDSLLIGSDSPQLHWRTLAAWDLPFFAPLDKQNKKKKRKHLCLCNELKAKDSSHLAVFTFYLTLPQLNVKSVNRGKHLRHSASSLFYLVCVIFTGPKCKENTLQFICGLCCFSPPPVSLPFPTFQTTLQEQFCLVSSV